MRRSLAILVSWLLLAPLAVLMIAFAVANRASVEIRFDPLPFAVEAPLFAFAYFCIFIGLVCGGLAAWLAGARWRRLARARGRELSRVVAEREQGAGRGPA
jgi:uncharacterized integral membrane protein